MSLNHPTTQRLKQTNRVEALPDGHAPSPPPHTYKPHHEPPIPVQPRRLLLQPVAVDLAVGRHVVQGLVAVEDLFLLIAVLVVDRRQAELGRLQHLGMLADNDDAVLVHFWGVEE